MNAPEALPGFNILCGKEEEQFPEICVLMPGITTIRQLGRKITLFDLELLDCGSSRGFEGPTLKLTSYSEA